MRMKTLAATCALAGLAVANLAHASTVAIEQSITLANPTGSLVYNIATNGSANTVTTSYYELIVDPSWATQPTKVTTFSTEPIGTNATYSLFTDTNSGTLAGNTGALLTSGGQQDVPGNNLIPFFSYLLTAGQYVLCGLRQAAAERRVVGIEGEQRAAPHMGDVARAHGEVLPAVVVDQCR